MNPSMSEEAKRQAKEHGVFMILEVIETLHTAGIICCIASVKALRYYGAFRVSEDWQVCVPDSDFLFATKLFDQLSHEYERGAQILPQLWTLLHTYPRFHPKTDKINSFYIVPSSEHFLIPLSPNLIEFSPQHRIPYPKLEFFAQSLVYAQKRMELADLVDGMNLDLEWGRTHLYLGEPTEEELRYVREKNEKITASCADLPDVIPGAGILSDPPGNRVRMWERIVGRKEERMSFHAPKENKWTRYRKKGSIDPRLKEDRPV